MHVIALPVELSQLGAEVGADIPHDLFAALEHRVVEHAAPVLRCEDQVCVQVVNDAPAAPDIRIWFPSR
jgi:hypothetical protein